MDVIYTSATPPSLYEARNQIFPISVPPRGGLFQQGATVLLGDFGAVVVGRNGAGKTRFLRGIGSEHYLIYDHERLKHFFGLVTTHEQDQPWDSSDDDYPSFDALMQPNEVHLAEIVVELERLLAEVPHDGWTAVREFIGFFGRGRSRQ